VAEAPAEQEELLGEPLVGASGYRWKEWISRAGLRREDFRLENVCEFRAPHNSIEAFPTEYIQQWMSHLHQRLALLTDPYVIVCMGNYALYALTGKGKVKWHTHDGKETRAGITDWRGSILSYTDLNGRQIKVIPTIHPAATFRQPDYEQVCIRDWLKIAQEGQFRETRLPQRVHATKPTLLEVETFLGRLKAGDVVAVDIENPKPKEPVSGKVVAPIVCLAFADRPDYSLTVPVTRDYWGDQVTVERVWSLISTILVKPDVEWIFHNGLYDTFHLAWERNIAVGNYRFDTLYMHHCLDPSDWHSLDYCASRDTREPFWKHEAKDPEEAAKYSSNLEAFWVYNGKDAAVTRELYAIYHQRLTEQGRLDFYLKHYAALLEPLQALQLHGIRVDDTKRRLKLAHLMADCIDLQDQLEAYTGLKLYGKTSLSTTKLKHYLYEVLGLPKQERLRKVRGEKTVSVDELAVRKLMLKHKTKLEVSGQLILDHKRKSKLREFCDEGKVDSDGYFRSSYSMNTEAGRLSSKSNPNGTGGNAQNQDRELRDMFLADEGMVGIEVDGSQVEGRLGYALIYMLTGNKAIYDKAMSRPDEYDQHTENASIIFQVSTDAVTKDQRYLGKKCVHGAFRDMQGKKLADELLKDGYVLDPSECHKYIEAFKQRVPGIDELFRWCRRNVLEHRFVESSWGHRLYFTYDRFSDEVYRRVYSFYMQADCAGWMNPLGLVPFYWYIQDQSKREGRPIGYINVHAHDSLFFSVLPQYAYAATTFLVESLEQNWTVQPKHVNPLRVFRVPCEVKCGLSWKSSFEWKRLPVKQEFEDVIYSLTKH
jgi:DNA polymerase